MSLDHGNGSPRGRVTRLRTTQQTAAQRKRMEAAIELLISALDALDVTVEDIEEDDHGEEGGDDEPSLGWSDAEARKGVPFQGWAGNTDLEDEHDGSEPSLGAPERSCWFYETYGGIANGPDRNRSGDQTRWAQGARDDGEDDDGDNPEEDPAEMGIGDADGLDTDGEPSLGAYEWVTTAEVTKRDATGRAEDVIYRDGDQSGWGWGCTDDREGDPAESGIADHDGLLEQCSRCGVE